MTDKPASNNPIVEQGLVLSEREYDVVSKVIVAFAQQCKKKEPAVYKTLSRVLGRLDQAQRKGAGLNETEMKIFQERVHAAFAEKDGAALYRVVEDLVAATFRCDADPGHKIAQYLLQMQQQVMDSQVRDGIATLGKLRTILDDAAKQWTAEQSWCNAPDTLKWILDTIDVGLAGLRDGEDAWPDEDLLGATTEPVAAG
jgi:hypothetical protein